MNGKEAYNNKFYRMSMHRIENEMYADEWKLYGFYNSLIIKNSYKTAYTYLGYVINFLSKYILNPENIDVDHYYGFMASLKNKSCSEQICAYHALQKYSKYLKAKNISEDYMKYIDRPKFNESQETIDKRENGYLTKSETKKFIGSVRSKNCDEIWKSRNYAIIMIFLSTGIRCSALYKLDVENVDLINKVIVVHEKGSKNRTINIPDQTVEAIKQWLFYRKKLLSGDKSENALILSNRKKRMETESIYCCIKKYGRVVTGKNITPHKLRATYGTQLYAKTKDLYFVQSCMGHTSPKTTEIYIRGQKTEISQKAADLMSGFLN